MVTIKGGNGKRDNLGIKIIWLHLLLTTLCIDSELLCCVNLKQQTLMMTMRVQPSVSVAVDSLT